VYGVTWAANGHSLFAFALRGRSAFIVEVGLDGKAHLIMDLGKNHAPYALRSSPDGRHLAFSQLTWESNAWLLENF
jgi:hypothetical protein